VGFLTHKGTVRAEGELLKRVAAAAVAQRPEAKRARVSVRRVCLEPRVARLLSPLSSLVLAPEGVEVGGARRQLCPPSPHRFRSAV
jgi:hypothetical protein